MGSPAEPCSGMHQTETAMQRVQPHTQSSAQVVLWGSPAAPAGPRPQVGTAARSSAYMGHVQPVAPIQQCHSLRRNSTGQSNEGKCKPFPAKEMKSFQLRSLQPSPAGAAAAAAPPLLGLCWVALGLRGSSTACKPCPALGLPAGSVLPAHPAALQCCMSHNVHVSKGLQELWLSLGCCCPVSTSCMAPRPLLRLNMGSPRAESPWMGAWLQCWAAPVGHHPPSRRCHEVLLCFPLGWMSTRGSCWPCSKAVGIARCRQRQLWEAQRLSPGTATLRCAFTLPSAQILPCSVLPFTPHCFIPSFLGANFQPSRR